MNESTDKLINELVDQLNNNQEERELTVTLTGTDAVSFVEKMRRKINGKGGKQRLESCGEAASRLIRITEQLVSQQMNSQTTKPTVNGEL